MNDDEFAAIRRQVASDDPAEVERGHARALGCMAEEPRCRALAAAAYDRGRALAGRSQKFGTQAVLHQGRRELWPVDRTTTDSERAKWGLPGIAHLREQATEAPLVGKAPLRRLLRERVGCIGDDEVARRAQAIAHRGCQWLATPEPGAVLAAYWPLPGEADPRPLALALAERHGWSLALPVVTGDELVFRRWSDGDELVPAGFGTFGPGAGAPAVAPTILLAPLLGYDERGGRLGQGKGYYDRYLAQAPDCLAVGIAHGEQRLPAVPTMAHDRALAAVLTEASAIRPAST